MFGLELWFVLAFASALAGGFAAFIYKISAARNLNFTVVNVYASSFSALITLFGLVYFSDFSAFWHPMLLFAFVGAATFFTTMLLKVEALKVIDTAIFFPLYKVAGPFFAIILGIVYFGESFSTIEWIGLTLSLTVPILLVTKSEHIRQINLVKGLWFVLIASVVSAISIGAMKQGTAIAPNVWMYIVVGELFTVLSSFILLLSKHKHRLYFVIVKNSNLYVLKLSAILGIIHAFGAFTLVFAFYNEGPLGIVYTINSLYILIPIVLSIIYYNEHWNGRKVLAIVLSIAALGLLK